MVYTYLDIFLHGVFLYHSHLICRTPTHLSIICSCLQTRIGVETQLAEEEASLEEERHKLRELEEIRFVLEKLLLDERQAMHDGEVARSLQSESVICFVCFSCCVFFCFERFIHSFL